MSAANLATAYAVLDADIAQEPTLSVNLYNTGLGLPECTAVFRAASWAGASAEQAWELARRHYAIVLRRNVIRIQREPEGKSDVYALTSKARQYRERLAAANEDLARVLGLANPFEQRGVAVMERAA